MADATEWLAHWFHCLPNPRVGSGVGSFSSFLLPSSLPGCYPSFSKFEKTVNICVKFGDCHSISYYFYLLARQRRACSPPTVSIPPRWVKRAPEFSETKFSKTRKELAHFEHQQASLAQSMRHGLDSINNELMQCYNHYPVTSPGISPARSDQLLLSSPARRVCCNGTNWCSVAVLYVSTRHSRSF